VPKRSVQNPQRALAHAPQRVFLSFTFGFEDSRSLCTRRGK
jgi:hypothetical protein